MIKKWHSFWDKLSELSGFKIRILILLAFGVIFKSCAIVFWDIGSVALLIENNRLFHIGFDFLSTAILLFFSGLFLWKIQRNKGYGSPWILAGCFLLSVLSLFVWDQSKNKFILDIIFILKYLFYFVLTTVFWSIASRFVKMNFSSLKFLTLFCLDLVGFMIAGFISVFVDFESVTYLNISSFIIGGMTLVFKILTIISPITKKVFAKITAGYCDTYERPLILNILFLSFLGIISKLLIEATLYLKFSETGISPIVVLGLIWGLLGVLGLVMVSVLYHTRYIYTTLAGMILLGLSVIATGFNAFGAHSGPIATGALMFFLLSHFYLSGYLNILPRVLSCDVSCSPIQKKINSVSIPLGFVLVSILCMNLKPFFFPYILIGIGILLIIETIYTANLYAQILLRMFEMRIFRRGPIIISYPRLLSYIKRLLKKENKDDVIYALRILETANHPFYEESLLQCMKHPLTEVRVFSCQKIRDSYRFRTYHLFFQKLIKKEKETAVKIEILQNMILTTDNPQKYLSYLKDSDLSAGAIAGYLKLKGDYILSVVEPLRSLVESKKIQDNINALSIIKECPDVAFIPFVSTLLKHSDVKVVQSALITAGRLRAPELLNAVFLSLDDVSLQESALKALSDYGKVAFPALEKMLTRPDIDTLRRKQIALFLGSQSKGEGHLILLRALSVENQKLKKTIIQTIIETGIIWTHRDRYSSLLTYLKEDVERIYWLLELQDKFRHAPTHESEEAFYFLRQALQEDIDDTRKLILYRLLLMSNQKMFVRAVHILLTDEYDLYSPALGMIQDILPFHLYRRIRPVLLLPLAPKPCEKYIGLTADDAVKGISEIIVNPKHAVNHWIRSTALYVLRRLGMNQGVPIAEVALSDKNPDVLEAAIWTLVRLQPDKEVLHQKLLTIPTTQLSRISLDKILDS